MTTATSSTSIARVPRRGVLAAIARFATGAWHYDPPRRYLESGLRIALLTALVAAGSYAAIVGGAWLIALIVEVVLGVLAWIWELLKGLFMLAVVVGAGILLLIGLSGSGSSASSSPAKPADLFDRFGRK